MYKQLETTKQEMVNAIEEMSKMIGRVHLDSSKINRQVGKLQTLVKYLPNNCIENIEKAEAIEKKRIEEIKPDKEKILQYAKRLTSIIGPDLKNSNAIGIILFAEYELNNIAENIIKQSEKL